MGNESMESKKHARHTEWWMRAADIRSLRKGDYSEVVSLDGVMHDFRPYQDSVYDKAIDKLFGWLPFHSSNYRNFCRVILSRRVLLVYEYQSMGSFDVYSIPLKEIVCVSSSDQGFRVVGDDRYLEVVGNCDVGRIVGWIESAISS